LRSGCNIKKIKMALKFDEYAAHGKEIVAEIGKEFGTEDPNQSGRILRSVLRALRNRMTIEESFRLLGQLPMCLKAVYVDGWRVRTAPANHVEVGDFRGEILKEDDWAALKDYVNEGDVDRAISAVFTVLSKLISKGEYDHIKMVLPKDVHSYIPD